MRNNEPLTFALGIFVGLILLSMVLGRFNWNIDSSVFVAICALALTIWQGFSNKKHYSLSLLPALDSWRHITRKEDKTFLRYTIHNKGHGSAKVTRYSFYYENNEVTKEQFESELYGMCFKLSVDADVGVAALTPISYLEKGEEFNVIKMDFKGVFSSEPFLELINKFSIIIEYSSFYGIEQSYESDWHNDNDVNSPKRH